MEIMILLVVGFACMVADAYVHDPEAFKNIEE